jgi:tetratricopeptide (TPR) repeat protein
MTTCRRVLAAMLCLTFVTGCTRPQPTETVVPPAATAPATPTTPATSDPATKEAWNDLAFAHMQAKNWPEAVRAAEEAVKWDPQFAPARFNLGASLYRMERYKEALPHLQAAYDMNKQQVEPGWYLALTYEQTGDKPRAGTILQELASRFPDDQDVRQAMGRLQAATPVTWTIPTGVSRWKFTGDKLIVERATGLEAVGPRGDSLWSYDAGGTLYGTPVYNDNLTLAIVTTKAGGQLVDLQTGARLSDAPPVVDEKGVHRSWRGDVLLHGEETPGMQTVYQVFRLVRTGSQVQVQTVAPHIEGGPDGTASPAGVLIPENFESKATLYRDGKPTATFRMEGFYEPAIAVTAAGDYVYRLSEQGQVTAYDLTSAQLWQTTPGDNRVHEWVRGKETWLATTLVSGLGRYNVLNSRGEKVASGQGYVRGSSARHLLISRESEMVLLSDTGEVVAQYPYTSGDCGITPDGNWVYLKTNDTLTAYPVTP